MGHMVGGSQTEDLGYLFFFFFVVFPLRQGFPYEVQDDLELIIPKSSPHQQIAKVFTDLK
jgi:hypothetical protein